LGRFLQQFLFKLGYVKSQGLKVFGMIEVATVKVEGKACLGLKVDLPESPPLLMIVADKGFVMCGFLNMDAAEKLGVSAALVSGVKTFEDVLNAEVKAATTKAKNLGIEAGMKGSEALKHMYWNPAFHCFQP
jgi:uncharacterized protein YunC (DUF1805 family)